MDRRCKVINAKRKKCKKVEIFANVLSNYSTGVVLNMISNGLHNMEIISSVKELNRIAFAIWSIVSIVMIANCFKYLEEITLGNLEEITLGNGARVLKRELKSSKKRVFASAFVLCMVVFFGKLILNSKVCFWVISRLWACVLLINIYVLYLSKTCLKFFDRRKGVVDYDTLFFKLQGDYDTLKSVDNLCTKVISIYSQK